MIRVADSGDYGIYRYLRERLPVTAENRQCSALQSPTRIRVRTPETYIYIDKKTLKKMHNRTSAKNGAFVIFGN